MPLAAGAAPAPAEVEPLHLVSRGFAAAWCALQVRVPGTQDTRRIDLFDPEDPDRDWPSCAGIAGMVPFRLYGRDYLAVAFSVRDSRHEYHRHLRYVVREPDGTYHEDQTLSAAVPTQPSGSPLLRLGPGERRDAVHAARIAALGLAHPNRHLDLRNLVLTGDAAFAPFMDARTCRFAVAGPGQVGSVDHTAFAPGTTCSRVLAAGSIAYGPLRYHLALFEVPAGVRRVAVTIMHPDGKVQAAPVLAAAILEAGTAHNLTMARAALARQLRRASPSSRTLLPPPLSPD